MNDKKFNEKKEEANKYFASKILFNIIMIIAGAALIALFLQNMQRKTALYKENQNIESSMNGVIRTLKENKKSVKTLTKIFHESNQQTVNDLKNLLTNGTYDPMSAETAERRTEIFSDVVERSGVEYLYIMDVQGNILLSPVANFTGQNLVAKGYLTEDNLSLLVAGTKSQDGTINAVYEKNDSGEYYFYSDVISSDTASYYLILGADVKNLNIQIESLNDISVTLKKTPVTNNGFMFAVDKDSGSYLYYENEGITLTGSSAADSGLTSDALKDGYSGLQKINGKEYYCVSRAFGSKTIICAVSSTEDIYTGSKYVVFWSLLGYVIIMLICLNYAIIVRNDFVRNKVDTRKKYLGANKFLILDISLLEKITPLLITGILLIFGISFYTQTLLEISNAITRSDTALDDVSSRYEESQSNRSTITEYYTNHYLSRARLIAYLMEEDPSTLNEDNDNQYSAYDESGNKYYLYDNEGNIEKSVGDSSVLMSLCESNDLENIFIYDDNGRTIAGSNPNWYFILSHDEADQSYPFRQVIDGITEYYIQEAQTNEIGIQAQYIGTVYYYYTTKDAEGNTLYVSRNKYEQYKNAEDKSTYANPITKHRGLLQIELKQEITQTMLASTDTSSIFSSDLLKDGYIIVFNNDDDHTVVYSPKESSIGKTAKEIGYNLDSFEDSYYGFKTVNGVTYFSDMRYSDGYYIATAIPKKNMYVSRFIIALFTAVTSLVIILILLMTVAFTTNQEEELYNSISDSIKRRNLNARVFNIFTPSGKSQSTISASARWDKKKISWSERTPEQKLVRLLKVGFGVVIIILIFSIFWASNMLTENSIILYIFSGNWEKGLNIFAFSACAMVLLTTAMAINLVHIPVILVTSFLGTRSETIGHLLLSVAQYGGTLASIFYCLYLLGLDSSSLLASAGILSLVIGLGAQSLIKDIIAGIFIVFEGEFRVGDIVTISDFRGRVVDIGLRTTKILNIEGNTKIYNNSEISGILNMTKATSLAKCTIGIEYGQDINYVEEVLKKELPAVRKMDHRILKGPFYMGVKELSPSCVTLEITAMCEENEIVYLQYSLNRYILDIFYRNHINIPFNTITISREADEPNPHVTIMDSKPIGHENTEKNDKDKEKTDDMKETEKDDTNKEKTDDTKEAKES